MTLPARTRALASAAVAALLLGLLSGITTPTGAVTGAPSAQATHRGPFDSVRVPHAFFGLHDGSGQGYQLDYGSLRLWDVHVTWRDIETSPGVYATGASTEIEVVKRTRLIDAALVGRGSIWYTAVS